MTISFNTTLVQLKGNVLLVPPYINDPGFNTTLVQLKGELRYVKLMRRTFKFQYHTGPIKRRIDPHE